MRPGRCLLVQVLRHHERRAADHLIRSEAGLRAAGMAANRAAGRFPLLDPESAAVADPLAAAQREIVGWSGPQRRELVEAGSTTRPLSIRVWPSGSGWRPPCS